MNFNKKYSVLLFLMLYCFVACSQNNIDKKRKVTMKEIIHCFKNNDTVELYKLMDTSSMIKVLSGEGFNSLIQGIQEQLKYNIVTENEINFIPIKTIPNNADYKAIIFLKNGKYSSMTLIFSFSQNFTKKIYDIDVSLQPIKVEEEKPFKKIGL